MLYPVLSSRAINGRILVLLCTRPSQISNSVVRSITVFLHGRTPAALGKPQYLRHRQSTRVPMLTCERCSMTRPDQTVVPTVTALSSFVTQMVISQMGTSQSFLHRVIVTSDPFTHRLTSQHHRSLNPPIRHSPTRPPIRRSSNRTPLRRLGQRDSFKPTMPP